MKQYNKLGLIAAVTIIFIILLLSNVTELARLVRYEPLTTDSPLLINIAVSNALTLISIKCVFYTYTIYYGMVLFYKVYQKEDKNKKDFDAMIEEVNNHLKARLERQDNLNNVSRHRQGVAMDININQAKQEEQPVPFNPKVVDLQFEPKIPNRLRLECYNSFKDWALAVSSDTKLDEVKAIQLNKAVSALIKLNDDALLTMEEYLERPKFIVDNVDLSLNDLYAVKGYLTNSLEEYIDELVNGVKIPEEKVVE